MISLREEIQSLLNSISPFDEMEQEHISFTKKWIESEAEIFRTAQPAIPDPHLVAYFLLFDPDTRKVLLVDHRKSGLWLPTGGHVEINEHPTEAVKREAKEELEIDAKFLFDKPIFLTVTKTINETAGHTDVSLWYVLRGNTQDTFDFNKKEFNKICWFSLDELPYDRSDPHMARFIEKLKREFYFSSGDDGLSHAKSVKNATRLDVKAQDEKFQRCCQTMRKYLKLE